MIEPVGFNSSGKARQLTEVIDLRGKYDILTCPIILSFCFQWLFYRTSSLLYKRTVIMMKTVLEKVSAVQRCGLRKSLLYYYHY